MIVIEFGKKRLVESQLRVICVCDVIYLRPLSVNKLRIYEFTGTSKFCNALLFLKL